MTELLKVVSPYLQLGSPLILISMVWIYMTIKNLTNEIKELKENDLAHIQQDIHNIKEGVVWKDTCEATHKGIDKLINSKGR